ncbi:MAG: efflux RND transporter permease subunit, partial [Kiritimatiellae bacterium]|nr:efflux RND transporter permease subunit [Kiritimatiellia bacterium]
MNLAGWCIKNNRTSFTFFALIAVMGVMSYQSVPRLENPDFIIRTAMVMTWFPGAPPSKVEELITDKLESKIQEMPEVTKLESQSMTGVSIIAVEVGAKYTDMAPIWQKLRNKVADVQSELPDGTQGPIIDDEFGDVFPVMVAVQGDGYTYRELKNVADDLRSALLEDPQVAKVNIFGAQAERIYVEFSNARLAKAGVSPQQLMSVLSSENILKPGGNAKVGPERIIIEASGAFNSPDEIRRVSIRSPGQDAAVYLQDIAEIRRDFVDPPESMVRYNGENGLILAISMVADGKVTDMAPAVVQRVESIQQAMPWGIELTPFFTQEKYVTRSINDFMVNLLEAFAFVVAVMFVFAGLRSGFITGILVPMAMLMCFIFMPLLHISLHQVSIAALIIALGMLVDNGVVTNENILVRLARGEDRLQAVGHAVQELWLPLLTSSLTTICAFLPIAIATSDVAEYCFSLFQVIAITLFCSWFLSLTLIPMLCYYFLKPEKTAQTFDNVFYRTYRTLLVGALKHRAIFCAGTIALLVVALWGFRFIPSLFFPPNEREMLLVDFWQPYGTDISTTSERLNKLEKFLLAQTNEIDNVACFIGSGGPRWYLALNVEQDNPNYANVVVTLKSFGQVADFEQRLNHFLENEFPDCRHTVKRLENGPPVGAPVKIYISGKDVDVIYTLRDRIRETIAAVPGAVNLRDDWGEWTKKLNVHVNQEKAKQAGFTSEDVATSLQTQISGMPVTEYREGKDLIPVVIRSDKAYREDLGKIESMTIYSFAGGANIPLLQIASTELEWQPSNIRRRNRALTMTLMSDVGGGRFASDVLAE